MEKDEKREKEEEGEGGGGTGTGGSPAAEILPEASALSPAASPAAKGCEIEGGHNNTNGNTVNQSGVSNGSSSGNSSSSNGSRVSPVPRVENAASLLLGAGRTVNDLLEALLRRAEEAGGDRGDGGNASIPSHASSSSSPAAAAAASLAASAAAASATVGAAATAWGAVALALPLEAERLAGPLRTALSSPSDRCSVSTRLALLRAVAATVGPAVDGGEVAVAAVAAAAAVAAGDADPGVVAGGGVDDALAVRGAATVLLRLLAPPSLNALRIEVDRAAEVAGGGGGDGGGEERLREACLLEGVHVAQIAFKVRRPTTEYDSLTCVR